LRRNAIGDVMNAVVQMWKIRFNSVVEVSADTDDCIAISTDSLKLVEVAGFITMDDHDDPYLRRQGADGAAAVEIKIGDIDARHSRTKKLF